MSGRATADADSASYVECAECGHPLEQHGLKGCNWQSDGCGCATRWTVKEIMAQRRAVGLPGTFHSWAL